MRFDIQKIKQYSIVPTYFLNDKRLSLKSKGLLAFMYSLPDDWDYSLNGLVKACNTGITVIRSCISELEYLGYLVRNRVRNSSGQFEYIYFVRIEPKIKM